VYASKCREVGADPLGSKVGMVADAGTLEEERLFLKSV